MKTVLELIRRLYPYGYSIVSGENDRALKAFLSELPFNVSEYPSGCELNGWVVPSAWLVIHAKLFHNKNLIYDATKNPLGVPVLSPSVTGSFTLDQLRSHLFFSDIQPNAVPYHWTNLYRPASQIWGFCIPKNLVETLSEGGGYDVDILTETHPSTMKVLDYFLPGAESETILLNAHNCHPFQANDDISGCAVGIRVLQQLAKWPNRRFSYRLIIAPELVGTVHWLHKLGKEAKHLTYAIMLKSVGNNAPLKLQESFTGKSAIDKAAHHIFKNRFNKYVSGPFRTIYGNDETVFDSPGYAIPSISLTRVPFPEYHTDADTPDSLSESALEETVETVLDILAAMELDICYRASFTGLVALSHPRYDLYRAAAAPGIDRAKQSDKDKEWNLLMSCLPRYLDGKTSLLEIADRHQLPINEVAAYVAKWVDKGLAVKV